MCSSLLSVINVLKFDFADLTHNPSVFVVDEGAGVGADEDGFHVFKRTASEVEKDEKRLTKLVSQKLAGNAPPIKKATKVVNFWYVLSRSTSSSRLTGS